MHSHKTKEKTRSLFVPLQQLRDEDFQIVRLENDLLFCLKWKTAHNTETKIQSPSWDTVTLLRTLNLTMPPASEEEALQIICWRMQSVWFLAAVMSLFRPAKHRALTYNYLRTPSIHGLRWFLRLGKMGRGLRVRAVRRIEVGKGQGSRWHPICPSYVRAVIPTD